MKLLIASSNRGKLQEVAAFFADLGIEIEGLCDHPELGEHPEETGKTFAENALIKARWACRATGRPALGDDSGLEVDALNGAPGIYSARYAGEPNNDQANNQKLLNNLQGVPFAQRTARFRCALAYVESGGFEHVVEGTVEGFIQEHESGSHGFGYDPLFYYPPFGCSLGEVSMEKKETVSHRGQALRALRPILMERVAKLGVWNS